MDSSVYLLGIWKHGANLENNRRFRCTLSLEKEHENKNLLDMLRASFVFIEPEIQPPYGNFGIGQDQMTRGLDNFSTFELDEATNNKGSTGLGANDSQCAKWLPQKACPTFDVIALPDGYADGSTYDTRRAAAPDDDGGPTSGGGGDASSCVRGAATGGLVSGTSSSGGRADGGGGVAATTGNGGAGANGNSNGGGGSAGSGSSGGSNGGNDDSSSCGSSDCNTAGGGTCTGAGTAGGGNAGCASSAGSGGIGAGIDGTTGGGGCGSGASGGHGVASCAGTSSGGAAVVASGSGGAGAGVPHTSISVGGFHPKPIRYSQELVQVVLFLLGMGGAGGIGAMQVVDTQNSISLKILLLGINISFGGCFLSAFVGLIAMIILYLRPLPRLPYLLPPTHPRTCWLNYSQCKGILKISSIVSSIFMVLAIIMVVCFNIGRQF